MTHKATQNWAGNYDYRGYKINKNERIWEYFDMTNGFSYRSRDGYGWTLAEVKAQIDSLKDA